MVLTFPDTSLEKDFREYAFRAHLNQTRFACLLGFVTFERAAFPHNTRKRDFLPFVASRGLFRCNLSGEPLHLPPRHRLGSIPLGN